MVSNNLIEQLRARHAEVAAERASQAAEAQRIDYGYAVVLGELERWIGQAEQPAPAPANGAELAEQLGAAGGLAELAEAEQGAPANGAELQPQLGGFMRSIDRITAAAAALEQPLQAEQPAGYAGPTPRAPEQAEQAEQ